MNTIQIKVNGMMCGGCENRVKNSLKTIEGINEVEADHTTGLVTIESSKDISLEVIKERIEDLGFELIEE